MPPGVALVGCGYWGTNLLRVFHALGALRWICDTDPERLEEAGARYPGAARTARLADALADPGVRAVAIATPSDTHVAVARAALAAGRDVFIEKPLALSYVDGQHLVEEAAARRAILMVGHVLQYHPAVLHLKQLVDDGTLGDLHYVYSNRLNLGRVRKEENILWSFAPHDISVMLLLAGRLPVAVSAFGGAYLRPDVVDVTISTLLFDHGLQGHIFVSWLHPFKEHRLVLVGSRRMAVFDDVVTDGKLRIYDKGITWVGGEPRPREQAETVVDLPEVEPLRAECAHFLDCVEGRQSPRTDGREGLQVLRVLEASQRALVERRLIPVSPGASAGV